MASSSRFQTAQIVIYMSMFCGYAFYAYNRKAVSFAMPKLMEEGLSKNDAGLIMSSQNLAYAISKFLGGVLSDKISARVLFSTGLTLSGLAALLFSYSDSVAMFAGLWFLNGLAQGCGWPACAKLLAQWYSPEQFGTLWSVLSASANISGGIAPFFSAFLILNYGWKISLLIAGAVSLVMGVLAFFSIINSPTEIGYKSFASKSWRKSSYGTPYQSRFRDLLKAPFLWLVALSYMVVFCAKTSTVDWGQMYLMEDRGHTQYVGSSFTSSVEIGGFFGGVLAGYITDWALRRNPRRRNGPNPRMPVAGAFMLGVSLFLHCLRFHVNESSSQLVIASVGFCLGACLYGPIAIFGVTASESAPPHLSGSAHAIVALAANIGAIISGLPFSYIAKSYNWGAIFLCLEGLCLATGLVILVLRNLNADIRRKKMSVMVANYYNNNGNSEDTKTS